MSLRRTVEPINLPIELSDARKQCEIGDGDTAHDAHLLRLAKAAVRDVERVTRRALITQTWLLSLADFPLEIKIPRPPLQSVTINYVNDAGSLTLLASSEYQVEYGTPATITPAFGKAWPSYRSETQNALQVTLVAGFGDDPGDVPAEYQNVVLELIAFRFFNRGDEQQDLPKHIRWALASLHCGAKYGYYGV